MSHANAALTPRTRLKVARLVIDEGWPIARVAERYDVSWPTVKRWATRYAAMGQAGMTDRSSRPHRHPNRTPRARVKQVVHLRWKQRLSRSRSAPASPCRPRRSTPSWSAAA